MGPSEYATDCSNEEWVDYPDGRRVLLDTLKTPFLGPGGQTLGVVGIAGAIHPMTVGAEVFYRDITVMAALTLSLFVIGYGFRGPGRINRVEGSILLACYLGYTLYLIGSNITL